MCCYDTKIWISVNQDYIVSCSAQLKDCMSDLKFRQYLTNNPRSNAVKLEKMFKKPFIGDFGSGHGHVDGVYSFAKDPDSLERFASSSGDGVIKVWDLPTRGEVWQTKAHANIIKSTCWTKDHKLLSAAADKTVKLWDPYNTESNTAPAGVYLGSHPFTSLSHHRDLPNFAVSSSIVSIYDLTRPATAGPATSPSATRGCR